MAKCNSKVLCQRALRLAIQKTSETDFDAYMANAKIFAEQYVTIQNENKGKVVGILHGKVSIVGDSIAEIAASLKDTRYTNQVYFRYVPREKETLVF